MFFFFQAEDGIRDGRVTGVQTCALPICGLGACALQRGGAPAHAGPAGAAGPLAGPQRALAPGLRAGEIGRASCRERVEISEVGVAYKKKKKMRHACTRVAWQEGVAVGPW